MTSKTKFEKGDRVRCIGTKLINNRSGIGWEKDLEFTITSVDRYISNGDCCFGGVDGNGVFEGSLELINRKTSGGAMQVSEIKVKDTKELKTGWTIRITDKGTNDHNYTIGELYKILKVKDSCIIATSLDGTWKGNNLRVTEFVLVQQIKKGFLKTKYQQFDISHLDKVILPDGHKRAILETLTQECENNRDILFNQWGFDSVFEKGKGIIFLFYGVPGTGKTLCAEMMAKYLQKDHLIMATAAIQSSIPGQSERNIQQLFKQAKEGKHLVVIDECDALLYDRNSVGMIMAAEINCLLTEIENFDGVCVMTTNRNHKLDPALERRIALKLEFPRPNAELRKRIWNTLIPKKCPLEKDVSLDKLASYSICGGNIKNVIFSSARRALHEKKKKVRMEDFQVSIEREMEGQEAFKTNRGRRTETEEIGSDIGTDRNKRLIKTNNINFQEKYDEPD